MTSSTDTDLLVAYLYDELPAAEREAVDVRLANEPALAGELASLRLTHEAYASLGDVEVPARVRQNVLRAARVAARETSHSRAWWAHPGFAMAAAVVIVSGGGFLALRIAQPADESAPIATQVAAADPETESIEGFADEAPIEEEALARELLDEVEESEEEAANAAPPVAEAAAAGPRASGAPSDSAEERLRGVLSPPAESPVAQNRGTRAAAPRRPAATSARQREPNAALTNEAARSGGAESTSGASGFGGVARGDFERGDDFGYEGRAGRPGYGTPGQQSDRDELGAVGAARGGGGFASSGSLGQSGASNMAWEQAAPPPAPQADEEALGLEDSLPLAEDEDLAPARDSGGSEIAAREASPAFDDLGAAAGAPAEAEEVALQSTTRARRNRRDAAPAAAAPEPSAPTAAPRTPPPADDSRTVQEAQAFANVESDTEREGERREQGADSAFAAALADYDGGNDGRAARRFRRFLDDASPSDPRRADALYYLGAAQYRQGDRSAAEATLSRFVATYPNHARADDARALLRQMQDAPSLERMRLDSATDQAIE